MSEKTMYIYALIIIAFIILMIFVGVFFNKSRKIERFSNKSTDSDKTDDVSKQTSASTSSDSSKSVDSTAKVEPKPLGTTPSFDKSVKNPIRKPLYSSSKDINESVKNPIRQPRQNVRCKNKYMKESIDTCLKNNDELKSHLHKMIKKLDEDSKAIKESIKNSDLKCKRL
jgi:FtsZ-interacting cell division protein ZipA